MLVDILLLNHVWVKLFFFDCDSLQFSSVTKLCLILCDPMDCSMPGLPVHHQLSEFTQTHVHWVSDAIQPSQPLSSPSPPTFNLSQHQCLFKRVSSSHQVAKELDFSFSISPSNEYSRLISFRRDWLDLLAVQRWGMAHLLIALSSLSVCLSVQMSGNSVFECPTSLSCY